MTRRDLRGLTRDEKWQIVLSESLAATPARRWQRWDQYAKARLRLVLESESD